MSLHQLSKILIIYPTILGGCPIIPSGPSLRQRQRQQCSCFTAPTSTKSYYTHFCRPLRAYFLGQRKKLYTCFENRGQRKFLYPLFFRVGQRARPYPSPHSHPDGNGRGSGAESSSAREKREFSFVEYLIPLGCMKKQLVCKNRLSYSNRTYVRS